MLKKILIVIITLYLSACVTVEPEKPLMISGAIGYKKEFDLPENAMVSIALVDLDKPGKIFEQKTFKVHQQPILFQLYLEKDSIDDDVNYGVVALIRSSNKILLQSYHRYPVINNERFMTEVQLKPFVPL